MTFTKSPTVSIPSRHARNFSHRDGTGWYVKMMSLRFIDFKTSKPQPAMSPTVLSSESNDSGSNDSAESNFEGKIHLAQSFLN
jgi:hypothetical protein